MTDTSALTDLASQLSPADRVVVGKVLDLIDSLATQIEQLATAIGALNQLDDLRNQQQRVLEHEIELHGERLATLEAAAFLTGGDDHSRLVQS